MKRASNIRNSLRVPLLIEKSKDVYEQVAFAAWNVDDALDGFHAKSYPVGEGAADLRKKQSYLQKLNGIFRVVSVLTILFAFFEPPLWCDNKTEPYKRIPLAERCALPGGVVPINSFFHFIALPPFWSIVVEALLLMVLSFCVQQEKSIEKAFADKNYEGRRHKGVDVRSWAIVLTFLWVDLGIYAVCRQQSFRLAPYCRFLLVFSCANVRQVFKSASRCIDEFGNVAIFLMGTVLFFAWLVIMVLDDVRDRRGNSAMSTIGGEEFGSFSDAFYTLFVISTGAAFPDDIDDIIKNIRWFSLIFYVFMILSFFLFTQLMLAVVYEAYQGNVKEDLTTYWRMRSEALGAAFMAMAGPGQKGGRVVHTDTFRLLIKDLVAFPRLKGVLKEGNTDILFAALDDDGSGELSISEFFDACYILQLSFWTTVEDSMFMKKFPNKLAGLKNFILAGKLENCVTVLLLMNSVFVIVESYYDIHNMKQPRWFNSAELFFSGIYMLEVACKLLVYSWPNYWASGENKFDFVVSVTLFLIGICTLFHPFGGLSHDIMRYFNILRILRMMKLLMQVPRFERMSNCIVKLVLISSDIAVLMGLTVWMFAAVGVQMFGGLLYAENPVLVKSEYVKAGYDVLNFNDLWGGFETLFAMMVCNYMPEYTDAMTKVSAIPFAGGIYQGAYFFFAVSIVFNIFTAFTIDLFVELTDGDDDDEDDEGGGDSADGSDGGGDDDDVKNDEDANLTKMIERLKNEGKCLHWIVPAQVMKMRTQTKILDGLMDEVKKVQEQIAPKTQRITLVA